MVKDNNSSCKERKSKPFQSITFKKGNGPLGQLETFILTQLRAAAPASLPVNIISQGLLCLNNSYCARDLDIVMGDLISRGDVIKISEGGLWDRYQLSEQFFQINSK